jgi:basic membrane lipoprotein Med (substrate-binding protein (PBP1-ABC) superfamily)
MEKTMTKRIFVFLIVLALMLPTFAVASAQAEPITSVCLVTDLGRVNDGTFNQYAYDGMVRAAEDLNLDSKFIETQAQTDYEANITTCVDEGFDAIITVGFLIADATAAAAAANPGTFFIGVDQFHGNAMPNLVGIQFREDQAGFLVGALAAQVTASGKIAGVYGIDIPPVKKFRNGFEQGARYINPDIEIAGVYIPDFVAPQLGAEAAEQFVADGFDVVFGAGGPTGSGGIVRAAELGAMVIGVDQDEFVTTFGAGETPGADRIISSALKRVDQGVYDMVWTLAAGDPLPEGSLYLMDAAVNGVGFAEAHDAVVPEEATANVQAIFEMLASGELGTGVDPVTGDLMDMSEMPELQTIASVCLVTDLGRVNDGTFNQYAYDGMVRAADDLMLDSKFIETQAQTDYEANIATCVDEGFDAIVTVGFLIADATAAAAAANPDTYFIGVDQFHGNAMANLVGIQFREDQAGFLVGALAAQVSQSGKIAGVYGIDIPPVKKFRNGFEQGARYVNPDIEIAGVYIPDFVAPQLGAEAAEQFVADGFDVIFGAGGPTGSGGIVRAAELGAMVIGVDQDEFVTTFGAGETPGADKIISSALKRVDQGVYDMIYVLAMGGTLPEGSLYLMDAAVNGVGFAEAHDAIIATEVTDSVQAIFEMLASGELTTGVDPVTGDLLSE